MNNDGDIRQLSTPAEVLFRRAGTGFSRTWVRRFARALQEKVAPGRAFSCLITDDTELRRLNARFLSKDEPTDVLSFPIGTGAEVGELAISADRARAQAREFGHTVDEEISILMLHGLLHLLGMDHEQDRGAMARAEKRWRTALGLPGGLIERLSQ
jgi:probable rRNA maturation factor